jgi:hypothetical protein
MRSCQYLFTGLLSSVFIHFSCNQPTLDPMNILAEEYVKIVLEIGQYNSDFVDAYYGPPEWKPTNKIPTDKIPPTQINKKLVDVMAKLDATDPGHDPLKIKRKNMLQKQCIAVLSKLEMLQGSIFSFDQECLLLYDAEPPNYDTSHFNGLLAELESLVPGDGDLSMRYQVFSKQFIIPTEKLDQVFQTAIQEARKRTKEHFTLPENESFKIEYVTEKSWSGYNYYQGNGQSLIQINTDLPIYIERAIDLACHEGYPGHHVFNALIEKNLVSEKKWWEFSVYPLFSPQSLVAEGSANYGIEMAFPGKQKVTFEREVLFPLAGLDTAMAMIYDSIQQIRSKLNYAGNEAARAYLDGKITRAEAAQMLEKYLLYEPQRALQRTRFIDQYRSYVINYNLGQDLVAAYIRGKAGQDHEARWKAFEVLLTQPNTASSLIP